MNGGANGSNTDEDMNDLFRSFLVDGEDLLAVSSQSNNNNHSGGNQAAMAAPSDLSPPAGFCLRVGVSGGAGGGGGGGVRVGGAGGGYEADGGSGPMRRRANTSPDCEDIATSSTQVRSCVRACVRACAVTLSVAISIGFVVLLSVVSLGCGFAHRVHVTAKNGGNGARSHEFGRKCERQSRILKGVSSGYGIPSSPLRANVGVSSIYGGISCWGLFFKFREPQKFCDRIYVYP